MTRAYFIVAIAVVIAASMLSCTSPVDINTQRIRTATATHFPLPEELRYHPSSVQLIVTESDLSRWTSINDKMLTVSLDTTFTPPIEWIGGKLIGSTSTQTYATARELYFHCDTLTAVDTPRVLKGKTFYVYAWRTMGTAVTKDTVTSDEMSAGIYARFNTTAREITDTLKFGMVDSFQNGGHVSCSVIIKVNY